MADAVLQECKLMALHQMVQRFAEIVDRVTWVTPEAPQDDDAVNAVAMLYHNKAHGKCMHTYMHLQIRLFVCLSCYFMFFLLFTHPSIHPLIHPTIHPSIWPSVRPSICPSIRPSVRPSIRSSVHPSTHHLFTHSSHAFFYGQTYTAVAYCWLLANS